ncbi:efflux RND transporter periplasmic adaptor subunit [Paenibacillus spongiae]|uniref:Efflux RND transporter periplasmic adaptor subunit n=1 Tax=Paenibacillus spongiae TaxID=2909671 RepID=A0ABY5S4Q8_9BACL|nr:efflux RND transporter periplasmic adaptor subunit [Paenibacillus spongiae]UVI28881.1 efflux RND transporter periplasmic adaptor subunit [Paenibacillus spongiae]
MRKWWLLIVGVLLVAGAVYAYFYFKKDEQPAAPPVNTTQVRKGTLEVSVSGTGSIQVGDRKTVMAGKQGTIKEVKVKENSVVKKGDVLVVLEGEDTSDQIKSEEVNLEKKLLELTDLQTRYKSEIDTNSLSSLDLSMKKQKLDIEQSRTTIAKLKEKQEEITITAPIGGTVKSLAAAADDELTPQTQIAEIVDYDNLQIIVSIDELDIPKVKAGQSAVISVEALTGQTFEGKVAAIADEGTASNGVATFDVTISVKASKEVKAGMSAEASISIEKKENTLILPIDAVQSLGNRYIVLLPSSAQGAGDTGSTGSGTGGQPSGGNGGQAASGEGAGGEGAASQPGAEPSGQQGGRGGLPGEQSGGQTGWQRQRDQGSASRGAGRFGSGTPQQIEVGIHNEDYIEVLSGLKEGDAVILPTIAASAGMNQQQAGMPGLGGLGGLGGGGGFPGGGGGGFTGGGRQGTAGGPPAGGSQTGGSPTGGGGGR